MVPVGLIDHQFVYLATAAPLFCAGITTNSPLKVHGAGPGKTVGVIGIGGLGHLAIQWAHAMKCDEVVAISTSDNKREESKKLGASKFVK
jgi:D-arabinose 1-dehydrogenase-like Zn-dependent alcohol dehydrogenase